MILDHIDCWKTYRFSTRVSKAFHFLEGLDATTPDGVYELDGRDLFATVMSYDTEQQPLEKLEVHRRYVDIQYAICGTEILAYTSNDDLRVHTPYDQEKDCEFLIPSSRHECVRLVMIPETFAVFFPQDAHFGKLADPVSGSMPIRKVVIKASLSLF